MPYFHRAKRNKKKKMPKAKGAKRHKQKLKNTTRKTNYFLKEL